ncbi:MAG: HD domain-containing protein [Armatimonadetes bacterium]|nr:HD domain-containing protein [Armatimonadota bacterium]
MVGSSRPYDKFRRASVAVGILMTGAVCYLMPPDAGTWQGIAAFSAFTVLANLRPVSVGKDRVTVTTINAPIHWAVLVLFGPTAVVLVAIIAFAISNLAGWLTARILAGLDCPKQWKRTLLSALAGHWLGRPQYPARWVLSLILSNASLEATMGGCAALAYISAGGVLLSTGYMELVQNHRLFAGFFLPFAASLMTYFVLEEAVYVISRITFEGQPQDTRDWYSFVLRCKLLLLQTVPITGRGYLLLPPITLLLVYLYLHVGAWSGLVVLGPFLSFRLSVQKAVEQQELYLDTIATLGTYMQHYHPYTRGHLKRVADMSERLARELKLPAETVMLMPYAGLLHDIGKVGVSEEILDKVGKLTDEEWATIKEHPVKGAEIVEHMDFLNRTVEWIRYHHKWANGSGYPNDGARNGNVPIEAAIIAVADAFDAMTDDREMSTDWVCDSCGFKPENGDRPEQCPQCGAAKRRTYREPLSMDAAIDELRRGAGSQFSPVVVKAFLQMVDREGIKLGGAD